MLLPFVVRKVRLDLPGFQRSTPRSYSPQDRAPSQETLRLHPSTSGAKNIVPTAHTLCQHPVSRFFKSLHPLRRRLELLNCYATEPLNGRVRLGLRGYHRTGPSQASRTAILRDRSRRHRHAGVGRKARRRRRSAQSSSSPAAAVPPISARPEAMRPGVRPARY